MSAAYDNTPESKPILEAALEYLKLGWQIHPVYNPTSYGCACPRGAKCDKAGKHPRIMGWEMPAQRTEQEVREWWRKWPDSNVGLLAGQASGVLVLDVDGEDGEEVIAAHGGVPHTVSVSTGKGRHLYFAHPEGENLYLSNKVRFLPGLDIRTDKGNAILPPSIHYSGRPYTWAVSPFESDLADAPEWLIDAIKEAQNTARKTIAAGPIEIGTAHKNPGYVRAAFEGLIADIERAPTGARNNTLNGCAYRIYRFVAGGEIEESEADRELLRAAHMISPAMAEHEIINTIASAKRGGMRNPLTAPETRERHINVTFGTPERTQHMDMATGELVEDDEESTALTVPHALVPMLTERPLTDTGTAECFAAIYGHRFRFCTTFKKQEQAWFTWDGSRWRQDNGGPARNAIVAIARARYAAYAAMDTESGKDEEKKKLEATQKTGIQHARAAENAAKVAGIASRAADMQPFMTDIKDYDQNLMLAGLPHGLTLDLVDGKARAAEQEDMLTLQLGTLYDPNAKALRWEKFVSEIFAGDKDLVTFVQRAIGYSLTGLIKEQALFLMLGGGANGKSTFLGVIAALMGEYGAATAFSTFDAERRNEQTEDLARLRGKRFVSVIEADEDKRLAEAKVKSATGGDPIECAFKYGHHFEYTPAFKLWMAMNHRPVIRDTTNSIWRRIYPIPFRVTFAESKDDKNLKDILLTELPGILNWALIGLAEWKRHGLHAPAVVLQERADYRKESDQLAKWMDECCIVDTDLDGGYKAIANDAYNCYKDWAKMRGEGIYSQTRFGKLMSDKGYKGNGTRQSLTLTNGKKVKAIVYEGFGLLNDHDHTGGHIHDQEFAPRSEY